MDIADTGERLLRLVGSFTKVRLVLGEVDEPVYCTWLGGPCGHAWRVV